MKEQKQHIWQQLVNIGRIWHINTWTKPYCSYCILLNNISDKTLKKKSHNLGKIPVPNDHNPGTWGFMGLFLLLLRISRILNHHNIQEVTGCHLKSETIAQILRWNHETLNPAVLNGRRSAMRRLCSFLSQAWQFCILSERKNLISRCLCSKCPHRSSSSPGGRTTEPSA